MRAVASTTIALMATLNAVGPLQAQSARYDEFANAPFAGGFLSKGVIGPLKDELVFQRATQAYLWALPALNMYGMKEGSEKVFGKGYNILPIFKDRLNAKTLITTPNSDVIYALGYLDLKEDGPMVIEVPPGLQGIWMISGSVRFARKGRSTAGSGAVMWACQAPIRARAGNI